MKETLSTFFTTYSSDKKYLAIAKLTCVTENEEMVWLQVQKACDGIMG